MANFSGIAAVGKSIVRLLNQAFEEEEPTTSTGSTKAVLVTTANFERGATVIGSPALSVFVYRVDFNKTMRASWSAVASQDGRAHLPLDVHFLISAWAANAEWELAILGKAIECLESTAALSGPLLHSSGDWAPDEAIQFVMEDISTEAIMRTFDSLPTDYRVSIPYIARVVRLDGRRAQPVLPVTTLITGKKVLQSS